VYFVQKVVGVLCVFRAPLHPSNQFNSILNMLNIKLTQISLAFGQAPLPLEVECLVKTKSANNQHRTGFGGRFTTSNNNHSGQAPSTGMGASVPPQTWGQEVHFNQPCRKIPSMPGCLSFPPFNLPVNACKR
jgi:hypothetical protein